MEVSKDGLFHYPEVGELELDLEEFGMTWETHVFANGAFHTQSAQNMQVLFTRAIMAGKIPPQFALRFGKEVSNRVPPRPGDRPNEICGLARYWIGSKVGGQNKRAPIPKDHPVLSEYEFATVGCCAVTYTHPDAKVRNQLQARRSSGLAEDTDYGAKPYKSGAKDRALASTGDGGGTQRRHTPRYVTTVDASTQTMLTQEQLAAWFYSLPQNAEELEALEQQQLDIERQAGEAAAGSLGAAPSSTWTTEWQAEAERPAPEPKSERTKRKTPPKQQSMGDGLEDEAAALAVQQSVPAVCGAPVVIGRKPGSNTLTCRFMGHCQHGPDASLHHMHMAVKEELTKHLQCSKDTTPHEMWVALQQMVDGLSGDQDLDLRPALRTPHVVPPTTLAATNSKLSTSNSKAKRPAKRPPAAVAGLPPPPSSAPAVPAECHLPSAVAVYTQRPRKRQVLDAASEGPELGVRTLDDPQTLEELQLQQDEDEAIPMHYDPEAEEVQDEDTDMHAAAATGADNDHMTQQDAGHPYAAGYSAMAVDDAQYADVQEVQVSVPPMEVEVEAAGDAVDAVDASVVPDAYFVDENGQPIALQVGPDGQLYYTALEGGGAQEQAEEVVVAVEQGGVAVVGAQEGEEFVLHADDGGVILV